MLNVKSSAFFASLLLSSVLAWSTPLQCKHVFSEPLLISKDFILADQELSEALLYFNEIIVASPTSLRQEDKYVVSEFMVDQALRILEELYPDQFELRDKKTPGFRNVTVTQYALPIKIPGLRDLLSSKLRFREYFQVAENTPVNVKNLITQDSMHDRQWVEFKTDHPDHEQTVTKPRVVMLKKDIKSIQNMNTLLENREEIIKRTLELKENAKTDPKIIRHFVNIMMLLYAKGQFEQLPLFAKTVYARDSYVLSLKGKNGENVEVQLTIDRDIKIIENEKHRTVKAYKPGDAVIEVKVPVAYAKLTEKDLENVPGLRDVLDLKNFLHNQNLDGYREGAGKLSTSRRVLRKMAQ
jgi:hypothetical protein